MTVHKGHRKHRSAFTLIELLAVIGIIAILASLLLSSFASAVRKSKETVCLSNMRQIGFMNRFYVDDNDKSFPPSAVSDFDPILQAWVPKSTLMALGGKNPNTNPHWVRSFPQSRYRPLHAYQGNENVFRCPLDKGHRARPQMCICPPYHHYAEPSLFDTIGCSYQYNFGLFAPIDSSRVPNPLPPFTKQIPGRSLPAMKEHEVLFPEKYIAMHEPPARVIGRLLTCPPARPVVEPYWSQWHRTRGKPSFKDPKLAPDLFYSATLFVDGHSENLDFTKSIKTDVYYPYEETDQWMWYQPRDP
ncbi:MAG: type II secretion system protein [Limisphaerales bacterium]